VVDLSIRYGIITPYTSYLIEEDDIFSQAARQTIVESELEEAAAAPREVSGEAAVDRADMAAGMAAAEAPAALELPAPASGNAQPVVKTVGSKTFVFRAWQGAELWMDTAFDADQQTPQPVAFASDAYFSLLDAAPELGQYLALGTRLLVVHDGVAYLIGSDGESAPLDLPTATPVPATGGETGEVRTTATPPSASPATTTPLCGAALLPLLAVAAVASLRRRTR
jgi:Ca-activated chloride channel homolog